MKLINYNLNVGKKRLLSNVNVIFVTGKINHILGKNGVGKSIFSKNLVLTHDNISVISSYSNLPNDITLRELKSFLTKKFGNSRVEFMCSLLNTGSIDLDITLRKLSDGQRQKLKILTFILFDHDIIILDEMTNALDKTTTKELYQFFNSYIEKNVNKVIINITHNLSDLNNMPGCYYLFDNFTITKFDDKEQLTDVYINGEI